MREVPWRGGARNVTERSAPTWKMSQLPTMLVVLSCVCGPGRAAMMDRSGHCRTLQGKGRAVCELLRMDLHIGKADMRILKLCDALNVSYVNNVLLSVIIF